MSDGGPHGGSAGTLRPMAMPLDATGVPNLDLVLGGGLRRGSLMLLVGPPGSGKTTLAAQMAFAAAAADRRVLVLAALSEPVSKLVQHLRTYRFFDEAVVGDHLRIHSLQQFLPQGLASTGREIAAIVRAERAGLVVLDGFRGLRDSDGGAQLVRQFLYDLGTALSLQGATTVITTEGEAHDQSFYQEATTADTIVALETARGILRSVRWLEVIKARGAAPLTGRHGMTVGAPGVAVHPRLEARVAAEPRPARDAETVFPDQRLASFGQDDLDAIFGGGLARATTTLVMGGLGTGKTLLGLHYAVAGALAQEPTVFLSLREDERQLRRKADAFDLGRRLGAALAPGGGLTLLRRPAVELDIELLADELLATLDRIGASRLVIDSMIEWERAVGEGSDARRVPNHLAALVEALQSRGITAILIRESGIGASRSDLDLPIDALSATVENVVWLHQVADRQRVHRVLSVPKTRYAPSDGTRHEFVVEAPAGIRVVGAFRSDHGVLDAIADQEAASPFGMPSSGGGADRGPAGVDPAGVPATPATEAVASAGERMDRKATQGDS